MQQRAAYLLERFISGSISHAELAELHELTESSAPEMQQGIQQWLESREADPAYDPAKWQQVLGTILNADKQQKIPVIVPVYKRAWFRYAAAAVVVMAVGLTYWLSGTDTTKLKQAGETVAQKEVPPGKDGAILTLADGSTVVLDTMGNGLVARQNGSHVVLENGKITYYSETASQAMVYNTMTTPRGRQFNLTLPDGTRVWLNAESSLRFPTAFTGDDRKVEVSGEAFFEVAQMKDKPFRVSITNGPEVEVLGTTFNVNAYADEPSINTTLLEGSVKVVAKVNPELNGNTVVLKPGQQAQSEAGSGKGLRIKHVDLDEVVAWKEGAFSFNDADLKTVMRQLCRWYNVDVEYAGELPEMKPFTGKMGRSLPLADVLAELKDYDVKFRIEGGNKIVVLP
ncbi:MAG: FecR domain-containing protein [Chitinophagaceae bacterium]|nr:FecR domain-containing protein [Chitinophagaceae bacterium]